jgi:hypothetical protein
MKKPIIVAIRRGTDLYNGENRGNNNVVAYKNPRTFGCNNSPLPNLVDCSAPRSTKLIVVRIVPKT